MHQNAFNCVITHLLHILTYEISLEKADLLLFAGFLLALP